MIKNRKVKLLVALAINLVIIVTELLGLVKVINELGFTGIFLYYTEDSNLFLLLTSVLSSVYFILDYFKNTKMPRLCTILKYASVCTVIETFLVVVFILGFTTKTNAAGQSGHVQMLFMGSMLYHHFLCPVIGCASFVLLENTNDTKLTMKDTIYASIPTWIYGSIIIVLNIVKVVEGPYPFLLVYKQTIWMSLLWVVIVLGCAYAITLGVKFLYNFVSKRNS